MGRLEMKKHAIKNQAPKSQVEEAIKNTSLEVESKASKEKKFYEMPWFWVCVTIIVVCITRPLKIIICGNCNGSGNENGNNNGNDNANNNGVNQLRDKLLGLCETEK